MINELMQKLGLEQEKKAIVDEWAEKYAKAQTKSIETSMQQRINKLTAELHTVKGELSDKIAKTEIYENEKSEYEKKLKDLEDSKKKYEQYENQQREKIAGTFKEHLNKLNVKESDKFYDTAQKIKSKLILKDNIDDYTQNEIERNLEVIEIFKEAGALTTEDAGITYPRIGERREIKIEGSGGPITRAVKKQTGKE